MSMWGWCDGGIVETYCIRLKRKHERACQAAGMGVYK